MNIEIITFYWSNNLGALIQAISSELLKIKLNRKVDFNRYMPKDLILAEKKSQLNKSNLSKLSEVLVNFFIFMEKKLQN